MKVLLNSPAHPRRPEPMGDRPRREEIQGGRVGLLSGGDEGHPRQLDGEGVGRTVPLPRQRRLQHVLHGHVPRL